MQKASFFIWDYLFYDDRIDISRNFFFTRESVIYIDKIEMFVLETDILLSRFGRCNLLLTFAGNIFTLFGLPIEVAEAFCEQVGYAHPVTQSQSALGHEQSGQVTISNLDLLKKSLLQTKLRWFLLIVVLLWAAVFLMGSELITSERAHAISSFVFRHMVTAGTLVLSLGLPTAIIWLWAFTGGFLVEFLKYYRYTATRKGNILCFEYGLIVHRRIYISADRIAITQFAQTPVMRIFGYGKLEVRAVGYNPFFLRSQPILPFVKAKTIPSVLSVLMPEIEQIPHHRPRRSLGYDFISWKCLLPFLCASLALIWGSAWLLVAIVAAVIVVCSVLLEYQNTDFYRTKEMTILSKGGFYRKAAWIRTELIELVAISASRRKKRKGFINLRIKVFGKNGTYAVVRNIDITAAETFMFGQTAKRKQ